VGWVRRTCISKRGEEKRSELRPFSVGSSEPSITLDYPIWSVHEILLAISISKWVNRLLSVCVFTTY
jgi:hypothetical protein